MTKQSILRSVRSITGWIAASAPPPRHDVRKSGNAMIFILLGVALFGALAYTFMRGAKSGQGNLSAGQARLAAQDIVSYAQSVEKAVNKIRARGCSQNQISFDYDIAGTTGFENAYSPVDETCHVFSANGGNVTWSAPSDTWIIPKTSAAIPWTGVPFGINGVYKRWLFPNTVCFVGFNPVACGAAAKSKVLVMSLYFLPQNVCEEINKILNVSSIGTATGLVGGDGGDDYKGDFANSGAYTTTPVNGAAAACMYDPTPGSGYSFYQILMQQ